MSKTRAPLEKSKMALLRGWDLSKKLVGKMMKEAEVCMHTHTPTLIYMHHVDHSNPCESLAAVRHTEQVNLSGMGLRGIEQIPLSFQCHLLYAENTSTNLLFHNLKFDGFSSSKSLAH